MAPLIKPTGKESSLGEEELIVSKADLKGHITYANKVFLRVAKYRLEEVIGAPHSLIRHPDMPRCVFKLLWDTIQEKREVFAYVVNLASNGDHYWVFAHVTPTFDHQHNVVGFHSNRRKPDRAQVERTEALYGALRAEEMRHANQKIAMLHGYEMLNDHLKQRGLDYDEFVLSI